MIANLYENTIYYTPNKGGGNLVPRVLSSLLGTRFRHLPIVLVKSPKEGGSIQLKKKCSINHLTLQYFVFSINILETTMNMGRIILFLLIWHTYRNT